MSLFRLAMTYAIVTAGGTSAATAQSVEIATDTFTAPAPTAWLRAKGDTLFVTTIAHTRSFGKETTNQVIVFSDSGAFVVIAKKEYHMPVGAARAFRLLLDEARGCSKPSPGCKLGEGFERELQSRMP